MEFEDLEPGVYGIRINPFDLWDFYHGLPKYPMMVIELRGGHIIVELSDKSKAILQLAMNYLENLTDGDAFTVYKDGSVIAWKDIVGIALYYGSG